MAALTFRPEAIFPKFQSPSYIQVKEEHNVTTIMPSDEPLYTINDLLVRRARAKEDVPLIAYPGSAKGVDDYVHYTARQLDIFVDEAVRKYMSAGLPSKEDNGVDEVVAILAPSSLDYVVSLFALSRLGYSLLLLSNRLSTEAYVNLLTQAKCSRIVIEPSLQKSLSTIQSENIMNLRSFWIIEQSQYKLASPSGQYFTRRFNGPRESNSTVFIIHSSGSTGLPKPIFQTQKAALTNYASGLPYRAFLTLPLYHNHGMSCLFRAIYAGNEIAMFNAKLPLTGANLIAALERLQPGGFHGVPYALKLLAESERGTQLLSACDVVQFGGSSCPDETGDRLVEGGVHLISHYGATEIGQLMTSSRPRSDKSWNYLRPLPGRSEYMKFDLVAEDLYELVVLDGLPSKVVSNSSNPPGSFRTADTFTPHPSITNAWKYVGRFDDRITLVNGEKVLPVTIEHQVRANGLVQDCWMFGVGREIPGMMIVPSEHAAGLSKEEILNQIWPSVQAANSRAEGFSQLSKEMIEVLDIATQYPQTDKGTMIRAKTYNQFHDQINEIYARFENGSGLGKLALDLEPLEQWLLHAFHTVMGNSDVENVYTDLFAAGVDSLRAITVFGMIKRELDCGGGNVSRNVVFEQPSVKALAAFLYGLRTGNEVVAKDECAVMAELIKKYSTFEKHTPGILETSKETILLTGATGSLGAHVLAQLIAMDNVSKVYCLVRASSPATATDRVLATLWSKLINPIHTKKIVCLPSDLSESNLGLAPAVLSILQEKLTKVIHCAWAVNFNIGVSTFEAQHIRGTHNLLNICLSVKTKLPASLYFCSSISAAAGTPIPASITESFIPELHHAQNMGYARSKLVTENIIRAAVANTGMNARVLRVGQIVGDSKTGLWNSTEAIPLMIRSAITMGALPKLDETPNWMPSDLVAKAILDITGLNSPTELAASGPEDEVVYHVQNTRNFHWTRDLLPALKSAGLEFQCVEQREWVRLLVASNPDPVKNPTIKLIDFFTNKYDNDEPGRKGLVFLTRKTGVVSQTVKDGYDVVGQGLVDKMVQRWKLEWAD